MTDATDKDPKAETLAAVIERVVSYEETATAETIRTKLIEGLDEAGIVLAPERVDALTARINDDPQGISASDYV